MGFVNMTESIPRFDIDHSIHTFQYSILVYGFGRKSKLRPYGQIGGGAQLFNIDGNSKNAALVQGILLKERWMFAANFGGGAKYLVSKNWGFRFDFRDVISGTPDYGLPPVTSETTPGFRPDGMLHNWQVSGGFFFSWEEF
jgi:opacity protein-like surface antigen